MSKILVVDDEKIMLLVARRFLEKKYEIVTANSGAEAIKIFEKEHPDMILSDLMMPEMDGYELHRILQEKFSETVPIMFMTADESDESESKGFEAGAADYIRKPLKPDVLLRRVENILNHLDQIHGLQEQAETDPMTGLLNKSASQKTIDSAAGKLPGALLMIDLDSFKLVNDIYGHSMGDKLLIAFAEIIKKISRAEDIAGRMGGDEFVVYLKNVADEEVLQIKTQFLNEELLATAKKLMGEDMEIPLGVSVGAVFSPDEGKDFLTLYKKADSALYEVKHHGKHGLRIFGVHHSENNLSQIEGISQIRMILGERNIEQGAYFVDFEQFKIIYRLLVRMSNLYSKGLALMQITAGEDFKEILLHSLRNSDCVTKSGNKFLILLQEVTEEDTESIKNRLLSGRENISVEVEKIF